MEKEPRRVVDSYFRKPRIYWEQQEEGRPIVIRPKKPLSGYFRKPHVENRLYIRKPSKLYLRNVGKEPEQRLYMRNAKIKLTEHKPRKPVGGYFRRPRVA